MAPPYSAVDDLYGDMSPMEIDSAIIANANVSPNDITADRSTGVNPPVNNGGHTLQGARKATSGIHRSENSRNQTARQDPYNQNNNPSDFLSYQSAANVTSNQDFTSSGHSKNNIGGVSSSGAQYRLSGGGFSGAKEMSIFDNGSPHGLQDLNAGGVVGGLSFNSTNSASLPRPHYPTPTNNSYQSSAPNSGLATFNTNTNIQDDFDSQSVGPHTAKFQSDVGANLPYGEGYDQLHGPAYGDDNVNRNVTAFNNGSDSSRMYGQSLGSSSKPSQQVRMNGMQNINYNTQGSIPSRVYPNGAQHPSSILLPPYTLNPTRHSAGMNSRGLNLPHGKCHALHNTSLNPRPGLRPGSSPIASGSNGLGMNSVIRAATPGNQTTFNVGLIAQSQIHDMNRNVPRVPGHGIAGKNDVLQDFFQFVNNPYENEETLPTKTRKELREIQWKSRRIEDGKVYYADNPWLGHFPGEVKNRIGMWIIIAIGPRTESLDFQVETDSRLRKATLVLIPQPLLVCDAWRERALELYKIVYKQFCPHPQTSLGVSTYDSARPLCVDPTADQCFINFRLRTPTALESRLTREFHDKINQEIPGFFRKLYEIEFRNICVSSDTNWPADLDAYDDMQWLDIPAGAPPNDGARFLKRFKRGKLQKIILTMKPAAVRGAKPPGVAVQEAVRLKFVDAAQRYIRKNFPDQAVILRAYTEPEHGGAGFAIDRADFRPFPF